jgi:hypothetical protein
MENKLLWIPKRTWKESRVYMRNQHWYKCEEAEFPFIVFEEVPGKKILIEIDAYPALRKINKVLTDEQKAALKEDLSVFLGRYMFWNILRFKDKRLITCCHTGLGFYEFEFGLKNYKQELMDGIVEIYSRYF